jgi:hypothetical protein
VIPRDIALSQLLLTLGALEEVTALVREIVKTPVWADQDELEVVLFEVTRLAHDNNVISLKIGVEIISIDFVWILRKKNGTVVQEVPLQQVRALDYVIPVELCVVGPHLFR